MYKLNWLFVSVLWAAIILQIPDSLGMEKDKEPISSLSIKGPVNHLGNGEFPRTPFYCMTSGRRPFPLDLMVKRSHLIRKTLVQIHEFSSLDKKGLSAFQADLHTSLIECVEICKSCDHPSRKLFSEQAGILTSTPTKRKTHSLDIKNAVAESFRSYYENLQEQGDIDIVDVRLMIQLILGEYKQKEVFKNVKILSDAKRDEIAIYYLMNFAFSIQLGFGDPSPYYQEASRLGCPEADHHLLALTTEAQTLREIMCQKPWPPTQGYDSSDVSSEAVRGSDSAEPLIALESSD